MYDVTQLHRVMEEHGLTVLGLSKKAGMPQPTVRRIFIRGTGHPGNLERLARALGMELRDIVVSNPPKKTRKSA